jgi:hypothetical protein
LQRRRRSEHHVSRQIGLFAVSSVVCVASAEKDVDLVIVDTPPGLPEITYQAALGQTRGKTRGRENPGKPGENPETRDSIRNSQFFQSPQLPQNNSLPCHHLTARDFGLPAGLGIGLNALFRSESSKALPPDFAIATSRDLSVRLNTLTIQPVWAETARSFGTRGFSRQK